MQTNIPVAIKNYYKACAIDRDKEGVIPMVNQIDRKILSAIIIPLEQKIYFRERNGIYTIKESVIGAGCKQSYPAITIIL